MGYHSELMIAEHEGPQLTPVDKNVCADCVFDTALAKVVSRNLTSKTCNYCGGSSGNTLIAASFDLIMERIYDSVTKEFGDAQDVNVPWVEGDWFLSQVFTGEVVSNFDPGWGDELREDIEGAFDPMVHWVNHSDGDWAVSDPSDTLSYGWEAFKSHVQEKTRYLFLSEPEDEHSSGRPDYIPIANMLDALGVLCATEGMVNVVPAGTEFYRVRCVKKTESISTFDDIGVPNVGQASAGRMNPAGISYLYVACDEATAIHEVVDNANRWYVAKFKAKCDINVIDFTQLPKVPSLFEPELYHKRHATYFIHKFTKDLIEPVTKDGKEHVDYVPTQIVSEYFRYRFRDASGAGIVGLKYPSVKNDGGVNLALFSSCNKELENMLELVNIEERSV